MKHPSSILSLLALGVLSSAAPSCTTSKDVDLGTQTFKITVVAVNDADPPPVDEPLPANIGTTNETWDVEVQAVGPDGAPVDF